jgi:hypothetical protein
MLAILAVTLALAAPAFAQFVGQEIAADPGVEIQTAANRVFKIHAQAPAAIVEAQPALQNEALVDTKGRLLVWRLEADGVVITQDDYLYLVVTGDNWTNIAERFGITVEKLQAANSQIPDVGVILRGELLHIPDGITELHPLFYRTTVVSDSQ